MIIGQQSVVNSEPFLTGSFCNCFMVSFCDKDVVYTRCKTVDAEDRLREYQKQKWNFMRRYEIRDSTILQFERMHNYYANPA